MKGYNIYLMIELAKCHGLIVHELEYDTAWAEGQVLYSKFEKSEFNVDTESEYDCINSFLDEEEKVLDTKTPENEVDLNIQALQYSVMGNMEMSNLIWSLIELKGYERLDYRMTLDQMREHQKTLN